MIINISGDINKESCQFLIDGINNIGDKEKLILYLNSPGGDGGSLPLMIDLINQNSDRIELAGYNELFSAAFDVFFKVKCTKILVSGTMGMFHMMYANVDINENGNLTKPYGKALKDFLRLEKQKTIKFCRSIGMTDGEISRVSRGQDVYFQYDRMMEMLNYQKSNGQYLEHIH